MKTKIKIKTIEDDDTEISINCAEREIEGIKAQIRGDFYNTPNSASTVEVMQMWER